MVGSSIAESLFSSQLLDLELVQANEDLGATLKNSRLPEVDLVVIETETLFPETISAVRELARRTKAQRTILIYHFTSSTTATALAKTIPRSSLKAPVSEEQLLRHCMLEPDGFAENASHPHRTGLIPPGFTARISSGSLRKYQRP